MNETGVYQFPEKPEEKSPFAFAHGMPIWKFFQQNKNYRKYFDDYMSTRRAGLLTWHENFPIASLLAPGVKTDGDAVLLVDVGGNKGHDIASFHKAHPDLPGRLILQDLPSMIETARADPPEGIELMPYDFFTPQPVKGESAAMFDQKLWSRISLTDHQSCHSRSSILLPQRLPRLVRRKVPEIPDQYRPGHGEGLFSAFNR